MKRLVFTLLLFGCLTQARTQPGQFAPDFTLTDITGTDWKLYDYLAQGIPVIIDFTATWCAPCWDAHTSNVLEEIYETYGPDGTGEVMVFFVESDISTGLPQLYGQLGPSQGNWVEGTSYPIIDVATSAIPRAYAIDAYPSIFLLSPDLKVNQNLWVPEWSTAYVYSQIQAASALTPPSQDAAVHFYQEYLVECYEANITVDLYNTGTLPLTEATIKLSLDENEVTTYNWSGNLAFGESEEIAIGTIPLPTGESIYQAELTTADDEPMNDTTAIRWVKATEANNQLVIYLESDENSEADNTRWFIYDEQGNVVLESGPIANNTSAEINLSIPELGCYQFVFEDDGENGLGQGYLIVGDTEGAVIFSSTPTDASVNTLFSVNDLVGLPAEPSALKQVTLYPNPTQHKATLQFELEEALDLQLEIRDLTGRSVWQESRTKLATGQQNWEINTSLLPTGIYTVSLRANDGVRTVKLVKE
ncbi:MAG: hypothetical protein DHS20C18_43500 [Saprospiraceae bacterium]|nr:MAG: hypothetical protein DHS20C18_43500 [Saprospiraceae bacterium]